MIAYRLIPTMSALKATTLSLTVSLSLL